MNQAGLLLYHFDTRDKHERDGEWTRELGGPALDLSHWQESYESADNNGASFLLLTGDRHDIPPSAGDAAVASVFGETLLAIALDAIASHSFDTLRLRDDCQLDMEEFDGMWAWPANYDDTGRTNILSKLTAPGSLNSNRSERFRGRRYNSRVKATDMVRIDLWRQRRPLS